MCKAAEEGCHHQEVFKQKKYFAFIYEQYKARDILR
jgi:hypothetical protein